MARDLLSTWAHKIAREFPDGAVCTWIRPGAEGAVIYLVPVIEVTGIAGLDPVVRLVPLDRSRVLGPLQVTSYQLAPAPYPPGSVKVMFDNEADAMVWNPRVPPALKAAAVPEMEPEPDSQAGQ